MNINHYTYRVTWSQEDGEHVSLCAEFPSLSWLAPTPEKALAGIRRLVGEVVADMQATGEPVPDPLSEKQYSGRFMVRVPSQVHRALATEAAEQGVIHSDINLLRSSGAGSGGARAPHIRLCMLRALRSGLPRPKAARYDFCRYV